MDSETLRPPQKRQTMKSIMEQAEAYEIPKETLKPTKVWVDDHCPERRGIPEHLQRHDKKSV